MDLVPLRLLFVPIYCAITYWMVGMYNYTHTIYGKTFERENFHSFRSFLAFRKSFPAICFCVNGGSYRTMGKTQSFSSEWRFYLATAKVFPLESFAVYGTILANFLLFYLLYVCIVLFRLFVRELIKYKLSREKYNQ